MLFSFILYTISYLTEIVKGNLFLWILIAFIDHQSMLSLKTPLFYEEGLALIGVGSSSVTLNPNYSVPAMSLGSYRKLLMKPFPALLVLCLKRCWAASLMPYALRRKYHSEEHPSITRRSHSFQFILGEPTRGLAGIYFNVIFIIASLDYVLLYHTLRGLSTVISVIICYILYQCNILNITHI